MKQRFYILAFLTFLILHPSLLYAQQVTHPAFHQVGNKVLIEFDLDKEADIIIYCHGLIYGQKKELHSLTGDVGEAVKPGHCIVYWDVQQEVEQLHSEHIRFEILAKPHFNNAFFFTINGGYRLFTNPTIGFTIGQEIKHFGWYASFSTALRFKAMTAQYVCDKDGYIDNVIPFYGSNISYSRLTFTAGALLRVHPTVAFYLGAGYGYNAQAQILADGGWVRNQAKTIQGIELQGGCHFNIKGFTLRAGVSSTNCKTIELNIGLGANFKNTSKKQK